MQSLQRNFHLAKLQTVFVASRDENPFGGLTKGPTQRPFLFVAGSALRLLRPI